MTWRWILFFLIALLAVESSWGACASPAGVAGQLSWVGGDLKSCDGNYWTSVGTTVTGTACSTQGEIKYNNPDVQYCNGSFWVTMNNASLGSACTGADIGDVRYDSNGYVKVCDGSGNWKKTSKTLTVTYTDNVGDVTDLTTYTFSNRNFGTASSDRYILVGVSARAAANNTMSSVTIGGVAATIVYQQVSSQSMAGFAIAAVPTGTTGNVVVTFSGSMVRAGIGIWALTGLSSTTALATGLVTTSGSTTNLNVPAGGAVFACSYGSGASATWVGVNEAYDSFYTDNFNMNLSGGHIVSTNMQNNLAVGGTVTSFVMSAIVLK